MKLYNNVADMDDANGQKNNFCYDIMTEDPV